MEKGYIEINCSIAQNPAWQRMTAAVRAFFMELCLRMEEGTRNISVESEMITVKYGQAFLTSRELSDEAGSAAIDELAHAGFIKYQRAKAGTIFAINPDVARPGSGADARARREAFRPPTVEEVQAYERAEGMTFDARRFVSFYEANGWRMGGNPMQNWQAACRLWQSREWEHTPRKNSARGSLSRAARDADRAGWDDEPESFDDDRAKWANIEAKL